MRKLLLATILLSLAMPGTADADEAIAEVVNDTPLAGWGGWAAWSRPDGSRFRLVLRAPDGTIGDARIPPQRTPFDASIGPDADARPTVVYTKDGDIRRYVIPTREDTELTQASSPRFAEGSPAIYGDRVAFTREIGDCHVPYVKSLASRRPSRRLVRSKCLHIEPGHLALRGSTVATSGIDLSEEEELGAKISEIRVYRTSGGSEVVARASWGEEPNLFGQVALDARHVSSVRHGIGALDTFLRVKQTGGSVFETRAHATLSGAFAKSSAGTMLYLDSQDTSGFEQCTGETEVPCRVIRAPRSPFGRAVRALAPTLTVDYVGEPRQSRPLTFRGRLSRRIVQDGRVIRTEPLPNVAIELRRRHGGEPETFEPTPHRGATDRDGRYEITMPPPIPKDPWFTAVAATPGVATWAGRGTVGSARP
jgi:hypothetical protein